MFGVLAGDVPLSSSMMYKSSHIFIVISAVVLALACLGNHGVNAQGRCKPTCYNLAACDDLGGSLCSSGGSSSGGSSTSYPDTTSTTSGSGSGSWLRRLQGVQNLDCDCESDADCKIAGDTCSGGMQGHAMVGDVCSCFQCLYQRLARGGTHIQIDILQLERSCSST